MRITDLYEGNRFLTDKDKILRWMAHSFFKFDPDKLTIEPDGLLYDGNLDLRKIYPENKLKVQFKEVTGIFDCCNTKIISLEGCPKTVGGDFSCSYTNISSLKFFPRSINGTFYCHTNKITDPKEYRWALYSEIGDKFYSDIGEIDKIINTYRGSVNRKHWAYAINLLSRVKL